MMTSCKVRHSKPAMTRLHVRHDGWACLWCGILPSPWNVIQMSPAKRTNDSPLALATVCLIIHTLSMAGWECVPKLQPRRLPDLPVTATSQLRWLFQDNQSVLQMMSLGQCYGFKNKIATIGHIILKTLDILNDFGRGAIRGHKGCRRRCPVVA